MWARVIEFMLACWLAASPFILHYSAQDKFMWANDFICACLVAIFSLLSFNDRFQKFHLFNLLVVVWLLGVAYSSFPSLALPPQENSAVIGLLLFMLAIIPSHATHPSRSWRNFNSKKK